MKRAIVHGPEMIEAEVPDDAHVVGAGVSIPLPGVEDIYEEYRRAVSEPLDTPPLREIARGAGRVLVAFDDPTVPCYAPAWSAGLDAILRELSAAGVDDERITLICANSLHRQFPVDELARVIGEDIASRFGERLVCHDAEDPDGMTALGTTPNGYHVDLNRRVTESDLTVYLNCSTTRGFSGGWKSIAVGLSSYRSIAHHHDPHTMSMSLDRNEMHEILNEMGVMIEAELGAERFFKVETVLSNPLQVARVFAGSVGTTRAAALEINRAHMGNRRDLLSEKVDVVAYGVPDWSPYAAFSHTNPILSMISTGLGYLGGMIEALGKPGCTVVLSTPTPETWDEVHHPSYREVWERVLPETKDPDEAKLRYEEEFASRPDYIDAYRHRFGFHGCHGIMALYPLKRLGHASRVIIAGPQDPKVPAHIGFDHAPSFTDALREAGAFDGASCAIVDYPAAVSRQ